MKKLLIKSPNVKKLELFKSGFIAGLGWSLGVTLGFIIVSTIIVTILGKLGGLPLIGKWVADIVESTQIQLTRRSILIR